MFNEIECEQSSETNQYVLLQVLNRCNIKKAVLKILKNEVTHSVLKSF